MDTKTIKECSERSLAGTITFPEVVMKLIGAGVERYYTDLVSCKKFYYGKDDEIHIEPLTCDAIKVTTSFDGSEIKNAITDSQQNRIDYRTFLRRAMSAGCSHYEVFITGKKVIYFGRDGSQYTEHFPQGK